jgi:hypothetical protein
MRRVGARLAASLGLALAMPSPAAAQMFLRADAIRIPLRSPSPLASSAVFTDTTAELPQPDAGGGQKRRRLPAWLEVHGEQRTRFESIGRRYRLTETGSDDVVGFRTRLRARASFPHFVGMAEVQDARMELTDSASTITNRMTSKVKMSQLSAGVRFQNLGAATTTVTLEVGRFSRDYGNARLIARPPYGNVSNAQDGAVLGVTGKGWTVTALTGRPVIYTYPALTFDDRFRKARFGGVYATTGRVPRVNVDVYVLRLDDGDDFPAASRRRFNTTGARLFGNAAGKRVDFENESVLQWGTFGALDHRAWFEHAQVGYTWPKAPWSPHLSAVYDQASGDADPRDTRNGTFDTLFGRSRFELGPTSIFGLVARSNLVSPGLWLVTTPARGFELSVQHRWNWLDEAKDRWRSTGLVDPTGRSGTDLGTQTDVRLRYRWRRHLEVDTAAVYFHDGAFVKARKPGISGRPVFFMLSTEWSF